jgi:Tfp pilus assembly protein PilX
MNETIEARTMNPHRNLRNSSPRRQQGIVMLIALTVLVAMSLAGVALIRSVDNTVVIAGNLAFKQGSLQVADMGVSAATQWLTITNATPGSTAQLYDDVSAMGYYSTRPVPEPDWFDSNTWSGALALNGGLPDSSGNVVKYIVHRMCQSPGLPPTDPNQTCGLYYPPTNKLDSNSKSVGAFRYEGSAQAYYRVTVRVEGPRNNVTITQSNVLI